jgi:hypothetical protein
LVFIKNPLGWQKETNTIVAKTKEAPKDDNKISAWQEEIATMLKYFYNILLFIFL